MAKPIRILICDDHSIVRKGLRLLLCRHAEMEVVAEAADGIEAVAQALALRPNIILMDVVMPGKDGVAAIGEIKQKLSDARILVLTSFAEDSQILPAIKAGAMGYLLKDTLPEELFQAILDVHRGKPVLPAGIAVKLMQELQGEKRAVQERLTDREGEVLKLVACGLTNNSIAERLVVSERTIGTHISNILDKLHLENRTQAALYALREGMTSLYPGAFQ